MGWWAGKGRAALGRCPRGWVDVAELDDQSKVRGPIGGYFVWDDGTVAPVTLVAGGSGVVLLITHDSPSAHQRFPDTGTPALLGVRSPVFSMVKSCAPSIGLSYVEIENW
jgi:hypothetical protein